MIAEALRFWDAIAGKVKTLIQSETKNAMRCERYEVTTAPNGTKVGVTLPMGTNEIFLPYSAEVADATVGTPVLVIWWGSMSNAKVYYYANGYTGALNAFPVGAVYESMVNTNPATLFGGTWQSIGSGDTMLQVEKREVDVASIAANTGTSFTEDFSDSTWFNGGYYPIALAGFGITGSSALTVNRLIMDPDELEISYLLRNVTGSATPATGVTMTFEILWTKRSNTPYRWRRIA